MTNLQYTVKRGDNLIKIARTLGLNSIDELIDLNPELKNNPNLIRVGQRINLPESVEAKSSIQGTVKTASMPNYDNVDYASLPESVRARVNAYVQAIRDGKMTFKQVPKLYQQHVFNSNIRRGTNEAAPMVAKYVLGAPWSIPDTVVRGALSEGRKAISRAAGNDTSNDYGVQDYFGNFSWTGKKFEEEHPGWALAADMAATPVIMVGTENLAARAMDGTLGQSVRVATQNAAQNAKAAAGAMGVQRQAYVMRAPEGLQPETMSAEQWARIQNSARGEGFGTKFQTASKGSGKTGTTTSLTRGGYKANTSGKGSASHASSGSKAQRVQLAEETVMPPAASGSGSPFVGTGYWHGVYAPLPEEERTSYVIIEPEETHIEHVEPANPWIYNTEPAAVRVPYRYGDEDPVYYEVEAKRGDSVEEQPVMEDSAKKKKGRVVRSAEEVEGPTVGQVASDRYFSNYGYSSTPMIIVRRKGGTLKELQSGGDILKPTMTDKISTSSKIRSLRKQNRRTPEQAQRDTKTPQRNILSGNTKGTEEQLPDLNNKYSQISQNTSTIKRLKRK